MMQTPYGHVTVRMAVAAGTVLHVGGWIITVGVT